jgi:hypothetical protein
VPNLRGVFLCCIYADEDLAVLKRQHIRRAFDVHELLVQRGHSPIRNQNDGDLVQRI